MKKSLLILLFIILNMFVQAQTNFHAASPLSQGTMAVNGRVIDAKTNEPIIGANVVIKGTYSGSSTDLDGNFTLSSIPKGDLTVTVSYVSYKPFEQTFFISDEENLFLDIKLVESITQMQTVNVVSNRVTGTEISMMQTIRQSNLVVNGVPSQLIKKTQDRDAGEVVKRIPGITIQDGRFVIIRGLNERYNSVWLNDLPAPSSEADVRAFSFDLIPASMIDNVVVYKTFSPELPGDFAGGLVQISTISNPEKNFLQVSYSNGFSEGSTFQQHLIYPVNGAGFTNSTSLLNLPGGLPENVSTIPSTEAGKDEKTFWGQTMNKIWTPHSFTAPTDQRFSVAGAWRKDLANARLVNYTQINYSTTFQQDSIFRASYNAYDEIAQKPDTSYCFSDVQFNNSVKAGAMMNWSLIKGKSTLDFRNLFNFQTSNRVTEREGKDFYGGLTIKGLEMAVKKRQLYSGQLSGTHTFGKKESKLKWFAGYSASSQQMPDAKRLTWVLNDQQDSPYYGQYGLNFSFAANSNLSGRIFHDMNEQIVNAGSDFNSKFTIGKKKFDYKAGLFFENRNRSFSARNLGYKIAKTSLFDWNIPYQSVEEIFSNENINATDGIMLDEQTSPSDSYVSNSNMIAGYFTATISVGSRIKIHTGVRAEQSSVILDSYKTDATNPPTVEDEVHYRSDTLLLLPALNLSCSLTEKSLLRFAYGQTVNRPEYREIAPMAFYDYEMKAVVSGNDSLTFATIHNYDFRYEFYPNSNSMFSLGAFHKQFVNAIEYQIIPTGSGLQYTFQNTPKASVSGIEAEMRLSAASTNASKLLKNFTVIFNAAYMKSRILFSEKSLEDDRPLQGQSPFIMNASLFYQNDSLGLNAGLMFNIVGKRISFVGDPFTGNPHIYEMPSNQLDLSLSKKFGKKIELKAQVRNLLNSNVNYSQNVETASGMVTQTTMQYRPGRYYLLGLVWKM
ncbi:MAG: hypothetical protein A2W93_10140 [Bacteroidetes bacterium GWF2_43_63]|nr:MAG: hypothetical protein A2W94_02330 [Bacteroidetes bacterium GWE2_42_42]OFY52883.1 MAG: hypothetical protein A2W93_10140 [Bacteroidetes bacterium GWF2_43_63]HBG70088.1 hypothetical protein [Bacteroidales bacterium]HCB62305.1 hypothetical protein [Bacteroidales bacterium]